ncbi:60S ribosomal protein L22 1 [Vanrija pseudolonga]|uniref:ferric-chelate reductase (NADPH) n=1 Tax=Vanrija pseudolonga TaxID=143232 RepID=A0AAF0Y481_9TREE|nr:60S ribosomal protein L22 1 [Vanrija pseudolonga]
MSSNGSSSVHTVHGLPITKPRKYHWYASRYMCAITLVALLALSARHLVASFKRRRMGQLEPVIAVAPPRWRRFQRSAQTWLFLGSFPKWLYGPDTIADGLCTLVYCALLFFFSINKSRWVGGQGNLANQMGVMAFSQLPLIILLVAKNNPVTLLTGITYQKLNFLHRAASRACLLCSWIHAIGWTPRVWEKGHFSRGYIISGLIALFAFTMLWTTSFRLIRRVAWEFFIVTHIVFTLLFLIGAIFHWKRLMYWVWKPALGLWVVDRLIRLARLYGANRQSGTGRTSALGTSGNCTVELLEWNVLRLTVRRHNIHWSAGQHAFLSMPTITQSLHESHPFSFANVPDGRNDNAVFIIKVHEGATKLLRDSMSDIVETRIPVYIEGPYGAVHSLRHWDSVLLVAGGTGVTFCLSHLHDLVNRQHGTEGPRRVRLVWHVRRRTDVLWVTPLLNKVASLASESKTEVRLDIFVTQSRHDSSSISIPVMVNGPAEGTGLLAELKSGRHFGSSAVAPNHSGLSPTLRSLMYWHQGRADLGALMEQEFIHTAGSHNPKATSSAAKTAGKPQHKFYVDYSVPANDNVFDPAAFEKFLHDRIKVEGKAGQLGDAIQLTKEGNKLVLTSQIPFSKRYLKYLTKKHLKKNSFENFLRVVATSKDTYSLRYFKVDQDEADDEE